MKKILFIFCLFCLFSCSVKNTSEQPPIETITQISKYFNVSADYLLGLNQDDLDKIERLKACLKEMGLFNGNDDMTKEDFEKALKIVEMMKEKKDTNNG